MERKHEVFVHGREERCVGHRDSGGQRGHRQRHEKQKLKSKDFFDAENSPMITFKSTKVVQTGPNTFDLEGDFNIRGVTKTEKLTVTDNGKGSTSGSIAGTMAFDRKD